MESQKEKKKKMLNLATGNRAQHIQSYLFLKYKVILPQRLPVESQKKKKNPVEPCNREQSTAYSELPFEIGLRLYHLNGCAKYHNFFFINCTKHKFCKLKFEISFWKTVGAEHFVANVKKKLRKSG